MQQRRTLLPLIASAWVFAVAAACMFAQATADLDYSRVHLVDFASGLSPSGGAVTNFLFRGNMPANDTAFQYDELMQFMQQRASEANITLPSPLYIIDISLCNIFDGAPYQQELNFFGNASNSKLGKIVNWPLGLAGILPPSVYSPSVQKEMALNGSVWAWDQIPQRIAFIRQTLLTFGDVPVAMYVHCSAGCDRTGEVIGAYRIQYHLSQVPYANVSGMYSLDAAECGRPPNYFSTSALEWFCLYYQYSNNISIGDCLGFAQCSFFGKCTAVPPAVSVSRSSESHVPPMFKPLALLSKAGHRLPSLLQTFANQPPLAATNIQL